MTQEQGSLPAAPEAGGLPMAPTEHDTAMSARPGSATSSAVLAFVQAGITAIATLSLLGFEAEGGALAASLLIKVAQFAGVGLLIFGGVELMQGKSKTMLVAGSILELVLCLAYLVIFLLIPTFDLELVAGLKAVLVFVALLFAVMPTISIIQAQSGTTAAWLGSRRAH